MDSKTQVLIVGGGIAGLTLANLLEKARIPYAVIERAKEFKPLGSAIVLGPQVFGFLDQLGLYQEIVTISKTFDEFNVQSLNLEKDQIHPKGTFNDSIDLKARFGYDTRIMSRPDLCNVLLKKIPKEKIFMSKRVLTIDQDQDGVSVKTSDGTVFKGHVLCGADGAYSSVRQSLFKKMEKEGVLPIKDKDPLVYNIDCCVGVSEPLDPKKYPEADTPKSRFEVLLLEQESVTMWYMPLQGRRMGWMITEAISKATKKEFKTKQGTPETTFRQSEWGPDAAIEACRRLGHASTPYGGKFKELLEQTPTERISKVMLEEKLFETWQHGRTCLLGDAAHKVLPFGGQGAVQSMLDALVLANLLYDLPSNSYADIRALLEKYSTHRRPYGKDAVEGSSGAQHLFHGRGVVADMARNILLNFIPAWVIRKGIEKLTEYRPQVTFLEFVPSGASRHIEFVHSPKYLKERSSVGRSRHVDSNSSLDVVSGVAVAV